MSIRKRSLQPSLRSRSRRRRSLQPILETMERRVVLSTLALSIHPAFAFVRDCAVVPARYLGNRPSPGPWLAALAANRHVTRLRRFGLAGS